MSEATVIDAVAAVEARLERLLGPAVAVAALDPRAEHGGLLQGEAKAILKAVPRRQREFAAGRAAARRVLRALGGAPQAIPQGEDRAPVWPRGFLGSIAHCETCCVAIGARSSDFRGLGVDIEEDRPLPPDLVESICTPEEAARLDALSSDDRARVAMGIFCVKEAVYKAQYPLSRTLIGFDAVQVCLDSQGRRFTATFAHPVGEFRVGHALDGICHRVAGLVVAAVAIR